MDLDGDAQSAQAADNLVASGAYVVRMLATEGREALDEGPGFVEGDVIEGRGDLFG
jgi:hypothetical protein